MIKRLLFVLIFLSIKNYAQESVNKPEIDSNSLDENGALELTDIRTVIPPRAPGRNGPQFITDSFSSFRATQKHLESLGNSPAYNPIVEGHTLEERRPSEFTDMRKIFPPRAVGRDRIKEIKKIVQIGLGDKLLAYQFHRYTFPDNYNVKIRPPNHPLFIAAFNGKASTISEYEGDINMVIEDNNNLLMWTIRAYSNISLLVIDELIRRGIEVNFVAPAKYTALDITQSINPKELRELIQTVLREAGAKFSSEMSSNELKERRQKTKLMSRILKNSNPIIERQTVEELGYDCIKAIKEILQIEVKDTFLAYQYYGHSKEKIRLNDEVPAQTSSMNDPE